MTLVIAAVAAKMPHQNDATGLGALTTTGLLFTWASLTVDDGNDTVSAASDADSSTWRHAQCHGPARTVDADENTIDDMNCTPTHGLH